MSTFWLSKLSKPASPFSFSSSDMKLSAAARENRRKATTCVGKDCKRNIKCILKNEAQKISFDLKQYCNRDSKSGERGEHVRAIFLTLLC